MKSPFSRGGCVGVLFSSVQERLISAVGRLTRVMRKLVEKLILVVSSERGPDNLLVFVRFETAGGVYDSSARL